MHPGANQDNSTNLVPVSVPGAAPIMAIQQDGKEWASVTHICRNLGVDPRSQRRKLHAKPWAVGVMMTLTAADGKNYETYLVDRRTLTMWLATIDAGRVAPEHREALEAYQSEAADALDAYFHKGGAINHRATTEQRQAISEHLNVLEQMELARMAQGIIHADHLEAKARIILARGMGETPELDPATRPLYAQTYLEEIGMTQAEAKKIRSAFGRVLSTEYQRLHGRKPVKVDQEVNGAVRKVNGYTEADRPLMDEVWSRVFADEQVA